MARDISTIPSTSSSDGDDLDINQILNSGADTDRDDFKGKDTPPAQDPPSPDDKGKTPPATPPTNPSSGDTEDSNELQEILSSLAGDNLDEENTALKTQLLKKYNGKNFNQNGDIVDESGNIVASVDVIAGGLDNDEGTVNESGDLVDAEGNVIKTKAELAIENSVVNKLHSELEFEFLDDKGKPKIYSDDAKGFEELASDIAEYKLDQFKASFFGQNPELAEVAKHLLSGGSLSSFKEPVDYSKVVVKDLDKAQKLAYIKESFKAGGMGDSRISAMLKRIEDSNEVDAETEEALADLTLRDKEAKKQRDAEYQKSIEERNKQVTEYWNNVEQVVSKGQLANLNIPDTDKQGFLDYISRPVDEGGNSKEMLDSSDETLEQKLAFSYIRYKGYKLDDLIDAKAKTKTVLSLKERLKRSAKMKPTPANDANGITSGNSKDVSIDSLLG